MSYQEILNTVKKDLSTLGQITNALPFYGHDPRIGLIACLSQWYSMTFTDSHGNTYNNAEQYMMANKAIVFNDQVTLDQIMKSSHPAKVKALGRQVKGYNDVKWDIYKYNIVVQGNLLKFSQNKTLKTFLLGTKDKVLIEASPSDRVWGVGLPANDADVQYLDKWRGLNLLGFALMEVREELKLKEEDKP